MSEVAARAELKALLARTAAFGVSPRRHHAASPEAALGVVLETIRTCILPRSLTVKVDDCPCLRIAAAGGGLLRILDLPVALPDRNVANLLRRPLRTTDAEDVNAVADLLRHVFSGGQEISFDVGPPEGPQDPTDTGISGDQLMRTLRLAPMASAVPDRLAGFMEAAEDVLLACMSENEEPRLLQPEVILSTQVTDRVQALLSRSPNLRDEITEDDALFLRSAAPGDPAICLTRSDKGLLALLLDPDACTDMATLWSDLHHGLGMRSD